ncbi:unnamed protein product [Oppiella nova]|uniref:Tetratricopeptide SHNi-TPR domain-containing protein n=1 Tax=Oppiella nova TaxID=334625 RepID=A0A7R9QRK7_9ACAR|nr:unnamed protein product [Oppiella nova]CAG2172818.1 unnamed protein product [Oppiella nova]
MESINTNEAMESINTNEAVVDSTGPSGAGTSSTSNDKVITEETDLAVEALNHLNQGKRHLLVEDYSSAVLSLQESCQLFDHRFGIGAEECGEAYLYYGTALLELARLEDGLFDGVVHTKLADVSETEDEEEADDEEGDGEGEGEGEAEDESQDSQTKTEDKKTDTEEDIEDSDEEKRKLREKLENEASVVIASSASADTEAPECVASTSKGETSAADKGEDTEDDASNIEVSWEVLSLAKAVFLRYIDKNDNKLKLSETLQKLGEISIEWENNQNAIEILSECLTLRKEVLAEDDRLIAETYYQLGIAYSFSNDIQNANNCFQSAIQVIETRIANQKLRLVTLSADDLETTERIKRELTQLENLLPEMRVKIEDSNDQMINTKEGLERQESERIAEEAIAVKNQEIKDKPITDISHLIKRKRQNSGSESNSKKVCTNGHNNGNHSTDKTTDETLSAN